MAVSKDLEAFESDYEVQEREIIVLTSNASGGAGKAGRASPGGADVFWTASQQILAYVDSATGELKKGDGRVVWPLTDKQHKKHSVGWPYNFKKETIYRLRARELRDKTVPEGMPSSFFNRFLVVKELKKNVRDERLEAILAEYRKPVILNDEEFGEFRLSKEFGQFEGNIEWLGEEVSIALEVDPDSKGTCTKAMNVLRSLASDAAEQDRRFRAFAAEKLTDLANDYWREENDTKITPEEFARRIGLFDLSIGSDGTYFASFNDDELFYGHVVSVYGNIDKGLEDANIEG